MLVEMRVTGPISDRVVRVAAHPTDRPCLPLPTMVGPRPSAAAEAARQPTQVWVPDVKEGYLPGWVHSEDEDAAEVVMEGGEVSVLSSQIWHLGVE